MIEIWHPSLLYNKWNERSYVGLSGSFGTGNKAITEPAARQRNKNVRDLLNHLRFVKCITGICEGLSATVSRTDKKRCEQGLCSMRMISSHFDNETAVIMVSPGTQHRKGMRVIQAFCGVTIPLMKISLNKIFPFFANGIILGISLLNNIYQLRMYNYLK